MKLRHILIVLSLLTLISVTVAGYLFNASLENARVEIKDSSEGFRSFTGLGLSGNVIGPWKTVVSLSWGYALASDIPEVSITVSWSLA